MDGGMELAEIAGELMAFQEGRFGSRREAFDFVANLSGQYGV
jgi:hypothetical protein